MSMLGVNGTFRTAGSRFITYGGSFLVWRWEFILCMKVVFPEPVSVRTVGEAFTKD